MNCPALPCLSRLFSEHDDGLQWRLELEVAECRLETLPHRLPYLLTSPRRILPSRRPSPPPHRPSRNSVRQPTSVLDTRYRRTEHAQTPLCFPPLTCMPPMDQPQRPAGSTLTSWSPHRASPYSRSGHAAAPITRPSPPPSSAASLIPLPTQAPLVKPLPGTSQRSSRLQDIRGESS